MFAWKLGEMTVTSLVLFRCVFGMEPSDYFRLISEVHGHFHASSVLLLHDNFDGLKELRDLRETIRLLSTEGICAMSMDFASLNDSVGFYRKRVRRLLFVVVLKSEEEVAVFSKFTPHVEMDYPAWLLVFDEAVGKTNSIKMPTENIFHLAFDTEMLVFRSKSKRVEEWYAIRNQTRAADFATWDPEYRLVLRSNKSLYERRRNLENSTIVLGIANDPSILHDRAHAIAVLFRKIIFELSSFLNFNVEVVSLLDQAAKTNDSQKNHPSSVIEMLAKGAMDVTSYDLVMTSSRSQVIDFTHPLIITRSKLYIRQPEFGIRWSGYLKTFSPKIWSAIGVSVLLTTILLTVVVAVEGNKITHDSFVKHLMLVLGIYCQQGICETPTTWPFKITCLFTLLSALVISAAFSGLLTSHLAVLNLVPPFLSLEGFLEDGSYKLIVFPDSSEYEMLANATDPTLVKMFSLIRPTSELPTTFDEVFHQICEDRRAFLNQEARMYLLSSYSPCKMIGIGAEHTTNIAIATTKNYPFYGVINYYLKRFQCGGIINRYIRWHLPITNPPVAKFHEVTLSAVIPALVILSTGIAAASLILLLELCYESRCKPAKHPGPRENRTRMKFKLRFLGARRRRHTNVNNSITCIRDSSNVKSPWKDLGRFGNVARDIKAKQNGG